MPESFDYIIYIWNYFEKKINVKLYLPKELLLNMFYAQTQVYVHIQFDCIINETKPWIIYRTILLSKLGKP